MRDKDLKSWPVRCRGDAHGIVAEIFHKKKDDASELMHWQLAAEAPGTAITMRGRALRESGVLFQKQGNAAKAEEQFRKALDVTPANHASRVECLLALSHLLIDQQRATEAVKVFDGIDLARVSSITSRGNLLEAHARALLAAGKKIRAIETFDQLLHMDLPVAWKDRINKELDQMAAQF